MNNNGRRGGGRGRGRNNGGNINTNDNTAPHLPRNGNNANSHVNRQHQHQHAPRPLTVVDVDALGLVDDYDEFEDDVVMGFDCGPTMTFNMGGMPMTYHFDHREGEMTFIPPGSSYMEEMYALSIQQERQYGRGGGGGRGGRGGNSHHKHQQQQSQRQLTATNGSATAGNYRDPHTSKQPLSAPQTVAAPPKKGPSPREVADAAAKELAPSAPTNIADHDPLFDVEYLDTSKLDPTRGDDSTDGYGTHSDNYDDYAYQLSDNDHYDNDDYGYDDRDDYGYGNNNTNNNYYGGVDDDEDCDSDYNNNCGGQQQQQQQVAVPRAYDTAFDEFFHRAEVVADRTAVIEAAKPLLKAHCKSLVRGGFDGLWQKYKALVLAQGTRHGGTDDIGPSRRIMPTGSQGWNFRRQRHSGESHRHYGVRMRLAIQRCHDEHKQLRALSWVVDDLRIKGSGVMERPELKCLPYSWRHSHGASSSSAAVGVGGGGGGGAHYSHSHAHNASAATTKCPTTTPSTTNQCVPCMKAAIDTLHTMIVLKAPMRQIDPRGYILSVLPTYETIVADIRRRIAVVEFETLNSCPSNGTAAGAFNNGGANPYINHVPAPAASNTNGRGGRNSNNRNNNTNNSRKQELAPKAPIPPPAPLMTDVDLMKKTLELLVLFRLQCAEAEWARDHVERYCEQFATRKTTTVSDQPPAAASTVCGQGRKLARTAALPWNRLEYDEEAIAANFSVFLRVLHDELALSIMRTRKRLVSHRELQQRTHYERDKEHANNNNRNRRNHNNKATAAPNLPAAHPRLLELINQQITAARADMAHLHRVTLMYYGSKCCCDALKRYQTAATSASAAGPTTTGPYAPANASCFTNLRKLEAYERYYALDL